MGYTETTNLKLKKPTALTPETDWPGYITGNFDTIDGAVQNRHKKDEDVLPDTDNVRSIGSAIKRFLSGFFSSATFSEIILGGVSRTTWPAAGSGSQSMDDTYNNGSVVNVDNTNEVHQLATGKKWKLTNADGSVTYMEAEGGKGITFIPFSLQNLLGNSPFGAWSNATLENVGNNLVTGWTNNGGYPYETFVSSGANITSAINTTAYGVAATNALVVAIGHIYRVVITVSLNSGTPPALGSSSNGTALDGALASTTLSAGANTLIFKAGAQDAYLVLWNNNSASNFEAAITLYEVTPGCIAADMKGPDGWSRENGTARLYREYNGANTHSGSFYSLKYVISGAISDDIQWPLSSIRGLPEHYAKFAGKIVTFGLWVKTDVANNFRIGLQDGVTGSASAYHTGDGTWQWLEVTKSVSQNPTMFMAFIINALNAATYTAYFSQPMLVFGPSIGQGNYSPRPDEIIWTETPIVLSSLDGKTSLSTTAATAIDIGADTSGLIGKGAKAVFVSMEASDSASAGGDCKVTLGPTSANQPFACSPAGLANSRTARAQGWAPLAADGTLTYVLTATGSATLAISKAKITGIQF
jgi:hypothetical protein